MNKDQLMNKTMKQLRSLPAFTLTKREIDLLGNMGAALFLGKFDEDKIPNSEVSLTSLEKHQLNRSKQTSIFSLWSTFDKTTTNWQKFGFFVRVLITWEILGKYWQFVTAGFLILTLAMFLSRLIFLPPGHILLVLILLVLILSMCPVILRWNDKYSQVESLAKFTDQIRIDVDSYVDDIQSVAKKFSFEELNDLDSLSRKIVKAIIKERIHRLEFSLKSINLVEIFIAFICTALISGMIGPFLVDQASLFLKYIGLIENNSSLTPEKFFPLVAGIITVAVRDLFNRCTNSHVRRLQRSLHYLEICENEADKSPKTQK
jgi:hypothetical protein